MIALCVILFPVGTLHLVMRMATLFGTLDAFDDKGETWEHHTLCLGHDFDANGVGDEYAGKVITRMWKQDLQVVV